MLRIDLALLVSFVPSCVLRRVLEHHLSRGKQPPPERLMVRRRRLLVNAILILVYNVEQPGGALGLDLVPGGGGGYHSLLDKIHDRGAVIFGHYS